jgi:hypothetical protein
MNQSAGGGYIRLPVSGSVFYFDPALPPEAQAVRVETAGFGPDALVYSGDILQGGLNHAGVLALPLRRGLRAKCKFDPYLPSELLAKQTREECIDASGAMEFLRQF